jgi:oligopeptide/dipeptide ABC transporter ATP-binding protein
MSPTPLLDVSGLSVSFKTSDGLVKAVSDATFTIAPGEVLAVVGESGSGKSVTALALMQLHPRSAVITGSAMFDGVDLISMPAEKMRRIRGNSIAMIFQDPMTALNPVFTVGFQLSEAVMAHNDMSKKAAWARSIELLDLVGVPEPRRRAAQYPHEFSGGMRQRAMIAMAISNDPKLLIADEPTTALDVTVQAQVMEVLRDVRKETGAAMMLITHDLGLVAGAADRVQVMYASRLFETASIDDIFYRSQNPYTRALLGSIPKMTAERSARLLAIPGNPPSLLNPAAGCPFMPRCTERIAQCAEELPELIQVRGQEHLSRCHLANQLTPLSEAVS